MNDLMGDIKDVLVEPETIRSDSTPKHHRFSVRSAAKAGSRLPLRPLYSLEGEHVTAPSDDNDKRLSDFFGKVDTIKELLAGIRNIQKEVIADNDACLSAIRKQDIATIRARMKVNVNQVSKEALIIKRKLEQLEADNKEAQLQPLCGSGTSSARIRSVTVNALRQKLAELMDEFQALNTRIKAEYRETVARRVYATTGQEANCDDIEQLIETGESEQVFQRAIQGSQVQDAIVEIRERHDAVKDLEKSLLELHQIFLDMATLVEAQGEMVDNIESQVAKAVDYVESGVTALTDAKQSQKSSRKLMCCVLVTVIIIIAIIIGIVAWKVHANRKTN